MFYLKVNQMIYRERSLVTVNALERSSDHGAHGSLKPMPRTYQTSKHSYCEEKFKPDTNT